MSQSEKEILWAEIERDYRTGAYSNRALARRYNVPESTLRGRAKQGKWAKDLKERLHDEVQKQLLAQSGADPSRGGDDIDDLTVQKAATELVAVLKKHRTATKDQYIGIQALQEKLNAELSERDKIDPNELRMLAQVQKQNSHSLANLITCDRKSYDFDEVKASDAPDQITITFYRQDQDHG
jgi:hypothetical protein